MFEQHISGFQFLTLPEEIKKAMAYCIKGQTPDEIIASLNKEKKLALFGAGHLGLIAVNILKSNGLPIDYFVDNDHKKIGQSIEGIPVISAQELVKIAGNTEVIIASLSYFKEIFIQLYELGILHTVKGALLIWESNIFNPCKTLGLGQVSNPSKIIFDNEASIHRLFSILADEKSKKVLYGLLNYHLTQEPEYIFAIQDDLNKQYFDRELLDFSANECFVDGGSLDGKTTEEFIRIVNGQFRKALLFEPNPECVNLINNNYSLRKYHDRINVIQQGLYHIETSIGFDRHGDLMAGSINDSSENTIETTRLDNYLNENISFIKLDIEGAELPALKGGEEVIRQLKPKLAIAVYHKPCDLWEIPLFVHDLCPEYHLYFRHYMNITTDTTLYAKLSEK
ncbi:MAG: FkbM family methyltransferase [Planctomycetaceae bacterium]|jgi:FkbM family methyltransferase|nr:FkbM family methyltransferase [Planctomycetaceae bacterium]